MNQNQATPPPIVLWIIHLAFMMSIPVYGVIGAFVLPPASAAPLPNASLMLAILAGVAAINLILALTADSWLNLDRITRAQQAGSAAAFLAGMMVKLVVVDALYEAIAIYGLVGRFLGFEPWWSYCFMAFGLLGLLSRITWLRETTDNYMQLKNNESATKPGIR